MTNQNSIYRSRIETSIRQAEVGFSEALSVYERLYKQAYTFRIELRDLNVYLNDPSDDMTVAELNIIEQHRGVLEMKLAEKCREMETAYHQVQESHNKVEELRAEAKTQMPESHHDLHIHTGNFAPHIYEEVKSQC
jgi:hypothetical protein